MQTNKLAKYISDKSLISEEKAEHIVPVIEDLMAKLIEFRRTNDIYRFFIDKAVVKEFLKTLK